MAPVRVGLAGMPMRRPSALVAIGALGVTAFDDRCFG
jgi:hypothetical protein